jgi:hypothetical protein
MRPGTRAVAPLAVALALLTGCEVRQGAAVRRLGVQIIYASHDTTGTDPRLRGLVKGFGTLRYESYQLRDEATFSLEAGTAGRMQLPNRSWLSLRPQGLGEDGRVRLEVEVDDLQLKSTLALAPGATVAVGGPPFAEGALILAVTLL